MAMKPPLAARRPKRLVHLGDTRIDPYYWLKRRGNREVLAYLKRENAHTEAAMARTRGLRRKLFLEMKSRVKQDERSAPVRIDDFLYYYRFVKGKEYAVHCRRRGSMRAREEVLLDVNALARGRSFCDVIGPVASPDHALIAFAVDTKGRRLYTIRFKDLRTGKVLPDALPNADGSMDWAADNRTLFYAAQDVRTLRSDRVLRHALGGRRDAVVFREKDETFQVGVHKTRSDRFLVIGSYSTLSTEMRVLEADRPLGEFRVFHPRERGHEYFIQHGGDRWYVRTNHRARNFKLMRTPERRTRRRHWKRVLGHRAKVLLSDAEAFEDHLVLEEREDGLTHLRVLSRKTGKAHRISFRDPAYTAEVGENQEYETRRLRFCYESLTTPESSYDYDMGTRRRVLVKRREVPGGFKPSRYRSERVFARARDNERVPISLVYRKGAPLKGRSPLHLTGYGAYGISFDPYFSAIRLSLLDRGFVFAIAHIRGGSEKGRRWYEDGRQLKKKNTFTDFVACSEHLLGRGYAARGRLYAEGGSAGGLLMGAVLNMRPDLYNGALVDVPFVDALTTMLDPSIPLTTSEYDEWGDPNKRRYYRYIKSYSPYDNVAARDYPNILATTGLSDSQVQYWEPAKWVAKLRAVKTDANRLLLRTDMDVGHGGASGRFEKLKLYALQYAFLLDLEGIEV